MNQEARALRAILRVPQDDRSFMQYHAALFDLDNTLVDTEPLHYEAYRSVMADYGIPVTPEDRLKSIGIPAPVNIARLVKEYGRTDLDPEVLSELRQQRYLDFIKTKPIQFLPGALEIVQWLTERNVPRIIASSSRREQIEVTLQRTGLNTYFSEFVSFEDVPHGKPAPDIYLEAAKRLGVDSRECVVFEDAQAGIISGKAAGCYCIAIPNQYTEHGDFSQADLVVRSLQEVDYGLIF